ncbi:hypothetical protein MKW98_023184 [Papaver atlanticum]|uniref:C2 domain-containing protein n=1 Tax=Papaver atlanticum TaxID=357466 RepID=A0AAD4XFL1_9MAGN|nr:hypothetical protein MKW98_023184 [Papaver atlanticum]
MGNSATSLRTDLTKMNDRNGDITTSTHNDAVALFLPAGSRRELINIKMILSASGLRYGRKFGLSPKCNPMVVVFKKSDERLKEIGRTEVRMNSRDPVWIKNIFSFHRYHVPTDKLVFRVYHVDNEDLDLPGNAYSTFSTSQMPELNEMNFIAEASCAQLDIIMEPDRCLKLALELAQGETKIRGTLSVRVEETVAANQIVEMELRCSKLENKGFMCNSDHFLRIFSSKEGVDTLIHETEVVMYDLNPTWRPICLTKPRFQSKASIWSSIFLISAFATPLVIECYAFNSSGSHAIIGKLYTSVTELKILHHNKVGHNFCAPSPRKDQLKMLKPQLFVDNYTEKTLHSFPDYIESGFKLRFIVAVDFAASNGDPCLPTSLHSIDPSQKLNAYQQAISKVGSVIACSNFDPRFLVWGFGGIPAGSVVSDCFDLNGSASETEVIGSKGILSAYSHALQTISLGSPAARFGEIITKASELACDQTEYSILFIITAGVLADIQESIDALVGASHRPLSIVIVGVGDAGFNDMEILDADSGNPLKSRTGQVAARDIVQFVPWCKLRGVQISVVEELFDELPGQFLTYMRSKDIEPL